MMFEEGVLNFILKCPNCNESYNDAKILPCGIYCKSCVDKKIPENDSSVEFECQFCTEKHLLPKNGFMSYDLIKNLNQCKPNFSLDDIYRGEAVQKLKENLKSIDREIKFFDHDLENCVSFVKEHCSELKENIFKEYHRIFSELEAIKVNLLNEIDEYYDETISTLKQNDKEMFKFVTFKNDLESYFKKWNTYLKNFQIKEPEIKEANLKASRLFKEISIQKNKFQEFTFDRKKIAYTSNQDRLNRNILGWLNLKRMLPVTIDDFKFKQFNDYIPDDFDCSLIKMRSLKNYDIIVCLFEMKSVFILATIWDNTIQKVKSFNDINQISLVDCYIDHVIFSTTDDFVIAYLSIYCDYRDQFHEGILIKFNLNLEMNKFIYLKTEFTSISTDFKRIYCINDSVVETYDFELKRLKNKGLLNPSFKPCLEKIVDFVVNNDYFFFLLSNRIIIIDKKDYEKRRVIDEVSAKNLALDSNDDLIFFDSNISTINKYNYDSEFMHKFEITGFSDDFKYLIDINDNIIFYDKKQLFTASLEKLFLK